MTATVTRHLRITGRVQGVGYRASLLGVAEQLGLKGWVRNCRDGSVEAVAQGAAQAVEDLAAWAQNGPPHARVDIVQVSEAGEEYHGPYAGFHVRADV
ncbi:MAG: acylphosphatase [Betaproteobacteria bacterium]|nr:acylphosphatase [Betaproteobacteria bacterium]